MQIGQKGLNNVYTFEYWRWFQVHFFCEISSPLSPHKWLVFSFSYFSIIDLLKIKMLKHTFSTYNSKCIQKVFFNILVLNISIIEKQEKLKIGHSWGLDGDVTSTEKWTWYHLQCSEVCMARAPFLAYLH